MSKRETIRAAFEHYDEDKSGAMDVGELGNLVEDLRGHPLDENDLEQAIAALDRDQSGQIELVRHGCA